MEGADEDDDAANRIAKWEQIYADVSDVSS